MALASKLVAWLNLRFHLHGFVFIINHAVKLFIFYLLPKEHFRPPATRASPARRMCRRISTDVPKDKEHRLKRYQSYHIQRAPEHSGTRGGHLAISPKSIFPITTLQTVMSWTQARCVSSGFNPNPPLFEYLFVFRCVSVSSKTPPSLNHLRGFEGIH